MKPVEAVLYATALAIAGADIGYSVAARSAQLTIERQAAEIKDLEHFANALEAGCKDLMAAEIRYKILVDNWELAEKRQAKKAGK